MEPQLPSRTRDLRFRLAILTVDRLSRARTLLFGAEGGAFRRWRALPVAVLAVAVTGALFALDAGKPVDATGLRSTGSVPGAVPATRDTADRSSASAPPPPAQPNSPSPSPSQPPATAPTPPPPLAGDPDPAGPEDGSEAGSAAKVIPPAATGLVAEPGDGQARVCWNPAPNATGYVMYHRDVTTGENWFRVPYPVTDTCSVVTQLANGHTYEFKVRSSNANGEADYSRTASATPAGSIPPPATGLTATPASGSARVCWNPAPNATGYVMYHRDVTTGENWFRVPYPVTDTCSVVTQLANGHTYEFKVRSSNANGEADYSGTTSATPG